MFLPTSIQLGTLVINNTDHNGAVSFGKNMLVNREVKAKKNQGQGQQLADGALRFATIQMTLDDEPIDFHRMKTNRPFRPEGGM